MSLKILYAVQVKLFVQCDLDNVKLLTIPLKLSGRHSSFFVHWNVLIYFQSIDTLEKNLQCISLNRNLNIRISYETSFFGGLLIVLKAMHRRISLYRTSIFRWSMHKIFLCSKKQKRLRYIWCIPRPERVNSSRRRLM